MIRLPSSRRAPELADWIELELLFGEMENATQTNVKAAVSDDLGITEEWSSAGLTYTEGYEPPVGPDELSVEGDVANQEVEEAFFRIERRQQRMESRYPFEVQQDAISLRDNNQGLGYKFMCLLNARVLLGLGALIPHHDASILFERLVKTALKNYLNGEAARFGTPLRGEFVGSFPERAGQLAKVMGERLVHPLTTTTPEQNDHGLDVVGWRHIDERPSKIVVLCQCGIGTDYAEKTLPPGRWLKIIDFVAPPLTALAIPFEEFGSDERWFSLATDNQILLDRSRIGRWCETDLEPGLAEEIAQWMDSWQGSLEA